MSLDQRVKDFSLHTERLRALHGEKSSQLFSRELTKQLLVKEFQLLTQVSSLLEKCSVVARENVKEEMESLVSGALLTVFEDNTVKFNINFVNRRGQIEAEFMLSISLDDKKVEGDILNTYGGGVVDVVATSLRLVLLELLQIPGPLILDEPGRMISEQYVENFGKFLSLISKRFDRQIILITHNSRLANYADKTIEVDINNGVSFIK